jgi:hypothetical protein
VGSVSVPLENKLPWAENYQPPQTEEFETPAKVDKAKLKMQARRAKDEAGAAGGGGGASDDEEEEEKGGGQGKGDASDEEAPMEVISQDPGLGAFDFLSQKTSAAAWTLPEDRNAQLAAAAAGGGKGGGSGGGLGSWFALSEQQFHGGSGNAAVTSSDLPDPRTLGIDVPESWAAKEWLEGRDGWMQQGGSGLEDLLKTSPFENYVLKKGCFKSNGTSTVRSVGKFKGLVSISEERRKEPLVPLERVSDYVCRLYVWKAEALQPSDPNGKADPYVNVKLGSSFAQSGRKSHCVATLTPEFYTSYEIPMKIPGESQLKLSVYDWDRFHLPGSSDTLIGETVIDLEDRYFHKAWKALGSGAPQTATTGPPKPIEARDLRVPDSANSQGKLYLWCEMLPAGEARARKPVTFEKPPPVDVEVRQGAALFFEGGAQHSTKDAVRFSWLCARSPSRIHWRARRSSFTSSMSCLWPLLFFVFSIPIPPKNRCASRCGRSRRSWRRTTPWTTSSRRTSRASPARRKKPTPTSGAKRAAPNGTTATSTASRYTPREIKGGRAPPPSSDSNRFLGHEQLRLGVAGCF